MRLRLVATVGLAALALVSCSSGSGKAADSTSTSTPTSGSSASKGCSGSAPIAPGQEKVTTTSGGTERWYLRHVPASYDPKTPTPVVLDLHGYSEGAQVHTLMSDLGDYGEEQGYITISPQGSGGAVARWDTALDSPDLAYIGDLLDEVNQTLCVDRNRVFVTGLSNGAFLTSAVACKYSDRIAAAAPVAGIRDIDGCKFTRPVPVVAFHGTADTFVAYNGGYGSSVANLPAPDGSGRKIGDTSTTTPTSAAAGAAKPRTIEQITADWAKRNGCTTKPTEQKVTADVTRITFPCPKDATTELYRVEGGGHSWPGSSFSKQVASVVGKTTDSISANAIMWKFFQEHPLTHG